jgi:hypothetical protein
LQQGVSFELVSRREKRKKESEIDKKERKDEEERK